MNAMKPLLRCTTLLVAVLALAAGAAGCGSGNAPRGKVLFIGLDGLEWSLLRPMVEAGEVPNLAKLMHNGVYGNLRSLVPLEKSPTIWTTIATGKTPNEHGIGAFINPHGGSPMTQNQRQVLAVWNILSSLDRTVGVIGWMQTWPAETVNGYMVSDYMQYGERTYRELEKRTYPPELEDHLKDLVVEWQHLSWDDVGYLLSAPMDTTELTDAEKTTLNRIRVYTAADLTFARIAERLYREQPTDFFAVYLRATDTLGHDFWNYCFDGLIDPRRLDPVIKHYAGDVMRRYYKHVDELLGPIIARADKETTIFVVSDHGFKGGTGLGIKAHKEDGVIILSGRGVGRGEITGATVYDITPTILAFMGLPMAQDMHGKILWSAMGKEIPRDRFTTMIGTYESGKRVPGEAVQSPVDDEIKERLKSLGYLDN
jgi:predicted AlkP superfamily phosphohydrolase/phosphomutase